VEIRQKSSTPLSTILVSTTHLWIQLLMVTFIKKTQVMKITEYWVFR